MLYTWRVLRVCGISKECIVFSFKSIVSQLSFMLKFVYFVCYPVLKFPRLLWCIFNVIILQNYRLLYVVNLLILSYSFPNVKYIHIVNRFMPVGKYSCFKLSPLIYEFAFAVLTSSLFLFLSLSLSLSLCRTAYFVNLATPKTVLASDNMSPLT